MWFLVHESKVDGTECAEQIDIFKEFFDGHPNSCALAREFVAMRLAPDMVERQSANIRMASYRWQDVKGVGTNGSVAMIPANFEWFLKYLRKEGALGWMDFVSNVGVNVPTDVVIAYMGKLYAEKTTVGDWLFSVESLARALSRGWIYQETAFGAFDTGEVSLMLAKVRQLGLQVRAGDVNVAVGNFFHHALYVGQLLSRRGYDEVIKDDETLIDGTMLKDISWTYYIKPGTDRYEVADLILRRARGDDRFDAGTHDSLVGVLQGHQGYEGDPTVLNAFYKAITDQFNEMSQYHMLDFFCRKEGDPHFTYICDLMRRNLTEPSYKRCKTVSAFQESFGLGIVRAYLENALSYEADRGSAVSSVAQHIASQIEPSSVSTISGMLEASWQGLITKTAEECVAIGGCRLSFKLDPHVAEPLAGLRTLEGTVIEGGVFTDDGGTRNEIEPLSSLRGHWEQHRDDQYVCNEGDVKVVTKVYACASPAHFDYAPLQRSNFVFFVAVREDNDKIHTIAALIKQDKEWAPAVVMKFK